jgi:hypothetical protein
MALGPMRIRKRYKWIGCIGGTLKAWTPAPPKVRTESPPESLAAIEQGPALSASGELA